MHFDELLATAKQFATDESTTVTLPDDWGQGRTAFGGVSAALLYTAIQSKVAAGRPLRSLSTNFIGPLALNEPFSFQVDILREGKSATQVVGKILQHGQIAVMQQACFGVDRESNIIVDTTTSHTLPSPEGLKTFPFIPSITPNFIQHTDLATCGGNTPFTGSTDSFTDGWMRFKQPPASINDAHLIALIDAWPPCVLQMMKQPSPASTMTWNLEFIHPHQPVAPTDWFAYKAVTRQAAGGYAHTEANIWDAQGELVAISRQCVAVFD